MRELVRRVARPTSMGSSSKPGMREDAPPLSPRALCSLCILSSTTPALLCLSVLCANLLRLSFVSVGWVSWSPRARLVSPFGTDGGYRPEQ